MKNIILALLASCGVAATADSAITRPHYELIGDFQTSNPLNWDTDTVDSELNALSEALVLQLDQGADVEIREIVIRCGDADQVCGRARGGIVREGRPLRLRFRHPLDVSSVTVTSKPRGFSVPPASVNVYLGSWDEVL